MLRHQEEEQTGYVSPIANLRVTPQELAEAVAAVESRREGEGGGRDTIAIGDAIEQLGLSVTPQEVYAEIQRKQNVKREAALPILTPVTSTKSRFKFRYFALALLISGSLMMNLFLFAVARSFYKIRRTPARFESLSLNGVTSTLPGYASLLQLHDLAKGASPATTMLNGYATSEAKWEVRKLDGQYVVRGYTYPDGNFNANDGLIQKEETNFFSSQGDDRMKRRTVRLDDFNSLIDPEWTAPNGAEGVRIPLQK